MGGGEGLGAVCGLRGDGRGEGGGEEDGEGEGRVVGEVDEALARHALPCAVGGNAFGGGAAPEESVLLGGEGGVRVGGGGGVVGFVHVVPGGGVEDVGVTVGFALREYGESGVRGFEGGG